ncbi:RnfH family protein [Aquisalimonas lutea]|uniref:RnfH family protein n=1 Tax=Aquisalimonas lutea TaxID=1327750 RepID=UPI0025B342FE|nr:RnfH family protein [Aquisalimonas lutea]MDN3518352.1 RnfH family protein [Aquisalimonas lutea]
MGASPDNPIRIQVACARPEKQRIRSLELPAGTTAREAVQRSGLAAEFPEIDPDRAPLGIYGRHVEDGHVLRDGDRVEVYRPLVIDPREARRQRARAKRS